MKKMKFIPLMMIAVCALAFTSCDKDDDFWPEDAVQNALKSKYPNATRVEWEKKRGYLVAECYLDNKEADVWFTSAAEWVMTETDLNSIGELPAAVNEAFAASTYKTWQIEDIDLLEYPAKESLYVIEVEQGRTEIQLFYTATGELTEEKNVSNADDDHWP